MTDQQPDRSSEPKSGNGKGENFPEPKAWAMEWQLAMPARFIPHDDDDLPAEQEYSKGNGAWEIFPQPRGWSLQWDGSSIAAIQEFYARQAPSTVRRTREDKPAPPGAQD
jgi:hypothetical protein